MADLLPRIHRAAARYRSWTEASERPEGSLTQLELFAHRAGVLETETIKPVLIWATDPDLPPMPADQLSRMLSALESWLVRRALLRLSTKNYNRFLADLLKLLASSPREQAGDLVVAELVAQDSVNTHWPGDDELRTELATLPIYRRLKRARVRMILEAIEDHERGFGTLHAPTAESRVRRGHCAIEHVMPQQWEKHWPIGSDPLAPSWREAVIHVLGNLTLLTARLNTGVSNGAWFGENGKLAKLDAKDVLLLNRRVRTMGEQGWGEDTIRARTGVLIQAILEIWPVPEGHVGLHLNDDRPDTVAVAVADLLTDGLLAPNQTLHGRGRWATATSTVLPDGRLQVGDGIYDTPSGAGKAIRKRATNGWVFWRTTPGGEIALSDLRNDYAAQFGVDAVADDDPEVADDLHRES